MWKIIIGAIAVLLMTSNCDAQNAWHQHNGQWHNHYHNSYHYHDSYGSYGPIIAYQPRVQWYFQGNNMNFGSAIVSPNRKYIQFGIYGGYYTYRGNGGVYFDLNSGQYRYYRR
jgi:hypothetical protein